MKKFIIKLINICLSLFPYSIIGKTSDKYHTFDELYYHRLILFSIICNANSKKAWKSKLHQDGTMFENYFIIGINTDKGQYSYHYHINDWDRFNVPIFQNAPDYDGHLPKDIERLLSI